MGAILAVYYFNQRGSVLAVRTSSPCPQHCVPPTSPVPSTRVGPDVPNALTKNLYNNFSPRLCIAWDPRGGWAADLRPPALG